MKAGTMRTTSFCGLLASCVPAIFGSAVRAADVEFNVVPSHSDVVVSITLDTPAGTGTDTDMSSMTGTVRAILGAQVAPFENIRIVDLELSTGESTSLEFCFLEIFVCLAGVNVTAAPGDLNVFLETPGAAAPVVAGQFTQFSNNVAMIGAINVDATGLADGQIPEGPFTLDSGTIVNDLPGSIARNGDTLVLTLDILAEGLIDDPDSGVMTEFSMTGTIVANGQVVAGLPGDLDCSGTVDIDDAPIFVEALLSPDSFGGCDILLADVNEDAAIDGRDIRFFIAAVLGN
jgi:hypothetical protein